MLPWLAGLSGAAEDLSARPSWRCTPDRVAACREVEVTCESLPPDPVAGDRVFWDFGDGGGRIEGPAARRVLPPGLTGYAVRRLVVRADGSSSADRLVLPLDASSLARCPPSVRAVRARDAGGVERDLSGRLPDESGFRIAVISDGNGPYGAIQQAEGVEAAVRALVERIRPDLVVHNGDLVAGQKRGIGRDRLRAMWEEYLRVVARPLRAAGIPLVPVPGNHDASPSGRLPDREVFREIWTRPENRPPVDFVDDAGYPLRYAFRAGGALFAVLDAPTGRTGADDPAWLARVLGGGGDPPEKTRLVFAHVPPWQPTAKAYGTLSRWPALAAVLRERAVDLLLTGHYELFFPTRLDGVEVVLDGTLAAACAPLADGRPGCRCRPLAGTTLCQGMSFVVLDLQDGALVRRFAVHGPDFDRLLPASFLPAQVGEHRIAPGWP